ncbi:hypothetical protein ACTNES_05830 [Blautia sp. HCP3S3_D9]|uniref:hypothetical protein n=1 Tax=Blautia sp. HCP3S3_D9 TaxID=3438912 RepID=UPI003F89362C
MREKRIRILIINNLFVAAGSFLYWKLPVIQKNNTNWISYSFIIFFFLLSWICPGIFSYLSLKQHFVKCVSSMTSTVFQIAFWSNGLMMLTDFAEEKIRIILNIGFLCLTFIFLCLDVRFETKPISGVPSKKEIKVIERVLMELELIHSLFPEMSEFEIDEMKDELNMILKSEKTFVHGMEQNFLEECRTIKNAALCKDKDTVELHMAMLHQLVLISKQEI